VYKLKITDTESRILHFAKEDINVKPRLLKIHGYRARVENEKTILDMTGHIGKIYSL
jgi:hypothetical protein